MVHNVYTERVYNSNNNRTTQGEMPLQMISDRLRRKLEDRGYSPEQIYRMDKRLMPRKYRMAENSVPKAKVTYKEPWRIRCLPYVYLAGVTKSGTTDLYDTLLLHPDIVAPSMKEPMFFDRNRLGRVKVTASMANSCHSITQVVTSCT